MNKDLLILGAVAVGLYYLSRNNATPVILPESSNGVVPSGSGGGSPVAHTQYYPTSQEDYLRDLDDRGIYGRSRGRGTSTVLLPYPSVLGRGWALHTRRQDSPCVWHSVTKTL